MATTKHCGGKTCDRPCRGISDCMLRKVSACDQREHYAPKILKILLAGPASTAAIAAKLELRPELVASYLRHLHLEEREIRQYQERPGFSVVLWRLGADPALASKGATPLGDDESDVKRTVVPARQMGMQRDPMVAAMFGLARGAGA
jgi:hypothetical protein